MVVPFHRGRCAVVPYWRCALSLCGSGARTPMPASPAPFPALPGRASPSNATPCQAKPVHALRGCSGLEPEWLPVTRPLPRRARRCPARPRPAVRGVPGLEPGCVPLPRLPRLAQPGLAQRGPTTPFRAVSGCGVEPHLRPSGVLPCLASPSPASPGPALPRVLPTGVEPVVRPSELPSVPRRAWPCLTWARQAMPRRAWTLGSRTRAKTVSPPSLPRLAPHGLASPRQASR